MPEIQETNYKEIKFSRNTTLKELGNNPVLNTIWKKFDTDGSGDFNDEEWSAYEKHLEKMEQRKKEIAQIKSSKNVISHYEKEILRIEKKYLKNLNQINELNKHNYFDEMGKFEEEHQISIVPFVDKKDVPQGAKVINIAPFQIGIPDEANNTFNNECYEKGYIKGLEKLSKEEQKQYLELVKKAYKFFKKWSEYEKEMGKNIEKFDKACALKDMAENGLISKVGSKDYEEQAFQQYSQIRNESNPFYKELQEFQVKYNTLFKKINRTEEDKKLLEQYKIHMQQLERASQSWSLSDLDENKKLEFEQGFKINNLSEAVTYDDNEKKLTNTHSIGVEYSNANLNMSANFSKAEKYAFKPEDRFENTYNASFDSSWKRNNFAISNSSNLNIDNTITTYDQSLEGTYKNLSLKVGENITSIKSEEPDENGEISENKITTNTTSISVSHSLNGLSKSFQSLTNSASVSFEEEGNTYSASSSGSFFTTLYNKENRSLNLSVSPSATVSYNDGTHSTTLNPSLYTNLSYRKKSFNTTLSCSEVFSTTATHGSKPQINNTLSTNLQVGIKNCQANLKFTDTDSPFNHSETYGANVAYNNDKVGNFKLEYSYQKSKSKMQAPDTETNMVTFTYTAPLESINKWFKKK